MISHQTLWKQLLSYMAQEVEGVQPSTRYSVGCLYLLAIISTRMGSTLISPITQLSIYTNNETKRDMTKSQKC